ncbi:21 kDa protein [Apostasia shenzhenica]|uniref:21 kDa protein n=1 Tax=Apostasia shenzhenica TaxID=1088818 RepID=A0A2H9ZT77_9ASPA|nr:21 kDa protein [Apostasia shenzhenica]
MASGNSFILAFFLALLFVISSNPKSTTQAARSLPWRPATGIEFIRTACSSTTYPSLCFSSLSSYASKIRSSPMILADAALNVSLEGARSASSAMRAMTAGGQMSRREASAMSDCVENVADSVEELRHSLGKMGNLRGKDAGFQIGSIQTWVSAALTDDSTCMDGFAGKAMDGKVKNAVNGRVANVAHLTSNALALISALASAAQPSKP